MAVQITREFLSKILHLAPWYINFPRSRREIVEDIEQFRVCCQCIIPQVTRALNGTNIAIVAPNVNEKGDYFSQKQGYIISTQELVGTNLIFLDVTIQFSGSCHNAGNFRKTSMHTKSKNGEIYTKPEDVIENSRFRPLLSGD